MIVYCGKGLSIKLCLTPIDRRLCMIRLCMAGLLQCGIDKVAENNPEHQPCHEQGQQQV